MIRPSWPPIHRDHGLHGANRSGYRYLVWLARVALSNETFHLEPASTGERPAAVARDNLDTPERSLRMRTTTSPRPTVTAAFALLCLSCTAHGQSAGPEAAAALERRITALEAETAATEAIRAVKRLQHAYAHYAEAGLWEDLADLFAESAVARLPSGTLTGKTAIRAYLLDDVGRGRLGLEPGRLNTELVLSPVVTLD